jgi:hypothetical protein
MFCFEKTQMRGVQNVAKLLRDAIDEFKKRFPFLNAFSSNAILPRHWETLFERMGGKRPEETDMKKVTMQQMIDIGVLDFTDDYEEIATAANKEHTLKRNLGQMKSILRLFYSTTNTTIILRLITPYSTTTNY